MSKAEGAKAWAEQRIGSPYIYGATGKPCTVSYREARAAQYPQYADKIRKNCPRLNKNVPSCKDCKWCDPETGKGKLAYDCAQLVRWCMEFIGISMVSGANSQWKKTDWEQQGTIDTIPLDKLCLVYRQDDGGNMGHTGIYTGNGYIIHAKGHDYGVVKQALGVPKFTHWGIPVGLYAEGGGGGTKPMIPNWPTVRNGDKGNYVYILQAALNISGVAVVTIDGKFGNKTETAVKKFQTAAGIKSDGICGKDTWYELLGVGKTTEATGDKQTPVTPAPTTDTNLDGYFVMPMDDGKALNQYINLAKAVLDKVKWE